MNNKILLHLTNYRTYMCKSKNQCRPYILMDLQGPPITLCFTDTEDLEKYFSLKLSEVNTCYFKTCKPKKKILVFCYGGIDLCKSFLLASKVPVPQILWFSCFGHIRMTQGTCWKHRTWTSWFRWTGSEACILPDFQKGIDPTLIKMLCKRHFHD